MTSQEIPIITFEEEGRLSAKLEGYFQSSFEDATEFLAEIEPSEIIKLRIMSRKYTFSKGTSDCRYHKGPLPDKRDSFQRCLIVVNEAKNYRSSGDSAKAKAIGDDALSVVMTEMNKHFMDE